MSNSARNIRSDGVKSEGVGMGVPLPPYTKNRNDRALAEHSSLLFFLPQSLLFRFLPYILQSVD